MMIVGLMAKFPVVAGLSFLEKIPPKFECLQYSSKHMTSVS